ncbi:hypothetical protein Ptr902_01231 [Pyrenophora tritici-repentis]|uniref:Uncharacterized protein n=1 Tax=Pyrenophora tritici-repentis TaxID=45151 RepID=A0A5M9LPW1_9PLEO|nr:hypothetical protein PtrV1_01668 [Pyrenophora tritici-repentis]KAF7577520.1 hypothetical protein PtrM4_017600 [Pyrenophora tritici-repentis]KAI0572971.1 hypothetical protein Alg130_10280 [Pyrenophora tritici-repentis]KAI0576476.1 hypothetical protein Alg215_07474 [Pyrenophora tritici-repentis]KAI0609680.1 hypothetical protein TUN205_06093 [Pyrenophora tritici-repentis]
MRLITLTVLAYYASFVTPLAPGCSIQSDDCNAKPPDTPTCFLWCTGDRSLHEGRCARNNAKMGPGRHCV